MNTDYYVLLTKDEIESLSDFIQMAISINTKYYYTTGQEEMDESDLANVKKEIDNLWRIYDQIHGKSGYVLDGHELIRQLESSLCFDVFNVLYENTWEIDNPMWLYNVLNVWKKCYDYEQKHRDDRDVCCGS